jgi:hypothetical protein
VRKGVLETAVLGHLERMGIRPRPVPDEIVLAALRNLGLEDPFAQLVANFSSCSSRAGRACRNCL